MPTLGDDTLDLLGQREDHDPLGVSFQEGEEGAGERGGGGGGTETRSATSSLRSSWTYSSRGVGCA